MCHVNTLNSVCVEGAIQLNLNASSAIDHKLSEKVIKTLWINIPYFNLIIR